eukprot:gene18957-10636_t
MGAPVTLHQAAGPTVVPVGVEEAVAAVAAVGVEEAVAAVVA